MLGAGDLASAGRFAEAAADRADRALAFDRAVHLYRLAVELQKGARRTGDRRALAPLVDVGLLHIRACDQSVGYFATMSGSSMALYSIEQLQYALDQIAVVLEGASATAMAS